MPRRAKPKRKLVCICTRVSFFMHFNQIKRPNRIHLVPPPPFLTRFVFTQTTTPTHRAANNRNVQQGRRKRGGGARNDENKDDAPEPDPVGFMTDCHREMLRFVLSR